MTDVRPCAMVDRETLIPCAFTICKDQARQVLCTMLANPPPIPIIGRPEFNVCKDAIRDVIFHLYDCSMCASYEKTKMNMRGCAISEWRFRFGAWSDC